MSSNSGGDVGALPPSPSRNPFISLEPEAPPPPSRPRSKIVQVERASYSYATSIAAFRKCAMSGLARAAPDYLRKALAEHVTDDIFCTVKRGLASLLFDTDVRLFNHLECICRMDDMDSLSTALIVFYDGHDLAYSLLSNAIEAEVDRTQTASTLFRTDSVASKIIRTYTDMCGRDYLRRTMRVPLQALVTQSLNHELDPHKLGIAGNDDDNSRAILRDNMERLMSSVDSVLGYVVASLSSCPTSLRYIAQCIWKRVLAKFNDESVAKAAVSGFFFLRFICPAIVNPEKYGILPLNASGNVSPINEIDSAMSTPSPTSTPPLMSRTRPSSLTELVSPPVPEQMTVSLMARRALVLVSKVIQTLANGVNFTSKEQYMTGLNPWLRDRSPVVQNLLEDLVKQITVVDRVMPMPVQRFSSEVLDDAIITIHGFMKNNLDPIVSSYRDDVESIIVKVDEAMRMKDILSSLKIRERVYGSYESLPLAALSMSSSTSGQFNISEDFIQQGLSPSPLTRDFVLAIFAQNFDVVSAIFDAASTSESSQLMLQSLVDVISTGTSSRASSPPSDKPNDSDKVLLLMAKNMISRDMFVTVQASDLLPSARYLVAFVRMLALDWFKSVLGYIVMDIYTSGDDRDSERESESNTRSSTSRASDKEVMMMVTKVVNAVRINSSTMPWYVTS